MTALPALTHPMGFHARATYYLVSGFFLDTNQPFSQEVDSAEALTQLLDRLSELTSVKIQSITTHVELEVVPHSRYL